MPGEPALLGRQRERAALDELLTRAATGPAALVLVGEAGIGKSALWRWTIGQAERAGFRVLSVRAAETEVQLSFGGLLDLFATVEQAVLDRLPAPQATALGRALLRHPSTVPADPRAVRVAALEVVRALTASQPLLLAVDDVQWLDPPTAGVVEYVVRRLGDAPVALVAALRADPDHALVPLGLGALGDERTRTVRVDGLALAEVHELVRGRTGAAWARPQLRELYDVCAGNPFFALELARVRGGGATGARPRLPPTLTQLLTERIQGLPEPAVTALLHASALAAPTVRVVRTAVADDTGLLAAEAAGMVTLRDGAVHFTHPLLSSCVYGLAEAAQRRAAHRRLAAVVVDAEERAWHLDLAADEPDSEVGAALASAAAAAADRGATSAAARLWERAATHSPDSAAPWLARAGECRFFAGDAAGARELYERALADHPPGPGRVRLLLDLALVAFYHDGSVGALAFCARALTEAADDPLLRALAHLRTSWYHLNDHAERARCARLARDELQRAPGPVAPELVALSLVSAAWYGFLSGQGFRPDDVVRARRLLPADGTTREATMTRNALRVFPRYLDPLRAREEFEAARRHAAEHGDESAAMQYLVLLAEVDGWLGRYAEAAEQARQAVAAAELTGQRPWRPYALYALAAAVAHLGQLDAAEEHAVESLQLAADDTWVATHARSVLGFVAFSRGALPAADRHFNAAETLCRTSGLAEPGHCDWAADHVEVLSALGEVDRARALLDRMDERQRVVPRPWLAAVTQRAHAVVHLAANRLDEAATALEESLQAHDAVPMPFARARTLVVQGRLLRRRKAKLAAREVLLEAQRIFDGVGARVWSEQVAAELRQLGLRRGSAHDLTPVEEQIVRLVVSGLSNREVAASEFVTPKTVEAHLSRIYRKLGVTSRRELARLDLPWT